MKLFGKKIPAKKIALLRETITLRKQLEDKVEEVEKERYTNKKIKIVEAIAKRDIPMIDYLGKLKDNKYLQIYVKEFVSHLRKYISLVEQEKYYEAIELNKQYFER
ncbi:MAG: hypothetical protein ACOC1P_01795 [Minisyncoccales bacterium]